MECRLCRHDAAEFEGYCVGCLSDDLSRHLDPEPLTMTSAEILRERRRVDAVLERRSAEAVQMDERWSTLRGLAYGCGITCLTMRQARQASFHAALAAYAKWLEGALCSAEDAEDWRHYYYAAQRYQDSRAVQAATAELEVAS